MNRLGALVVGATGLLDAAQDVGTTVANAASADAKMILHDEFAAKQQDVESRLRAHTRRASLRNQPGVEGDPDL